MLEEMVGKINMVMTMRVLQDMFFIKALLLKIELMKRRFVLELEQGAETYIPSDLSTRDLPVSFRFYDPVLKMVDNLIDPNTRQYFNLRTELKMNSLRDRYYYFNKTLA